MSAIESAMITSREDAARELRQCACQPCYSRSRSVSFCSYSARSRWISLSESFVLACRVVVIHQLCTDLRDPVQFAGGISTAKVIVERMEGTDV